MRHENLWNVYVNKGELCVCDDKGNEIKATIKTQIIQDWDTTAQEIYNPRDGRAFVTITFLANLFETKEKMMESINKP